MLRKLYKTRRKVTQAASDKSGTAAIEFAMISPILLVTLLGGTEITQAVMAARKVATASRTMADLTAQIRGATDLTPAMVDEIYAAGRLILTPHPAGSLKVTVSRVDVTSGPPNANRNGNGNGNGNGPNANAIANANPNANLGGNAPPQASLTARTVWSVTRNGATSRPCGPLSKSPNTADPAPDKFPEGMHYVGRFIVVDVTYIFAAPLTTNFAPQNMGFSGWTNTGNGIEIRRTAYMQTRLDGAPTVTGAGSCPVVA